MNTKEYLLAKLGEEAIEVAHEVHKALSFGLDDRDISKGATGPTCAERVRSELIDMLGALQVLHEEGIEFYLPIDWARMRPTDRAALEAKRQKIRKYLAYAKSVGAVIDPEPLV